MQVMKRSALHCKGCEKVDSAHSTVKVMKR